MRLAKSRPLVDLSSECHLTEHGAGGFDTFFGYHDVTPFSPDDRLLLATRRRVDSGLRSAGTPLELGCFDLSVKDPSFEPFGMSTAWCWQQGCRLQWWSDSRTPSRVVFFNVTRRGRHESSLLDIFTRTTTQNIDRALYGLSPDGRFGTSLNFSRLQRLRPGYGYADLPDASCGERAPGEDGLWLVDVRLGTAQLVLTLADAASREPDPSMADADHYFNHVLWNSGSTRFFFLHLWKLRDGTRRSRAFIWDIESQSCWLLGPRQHVSHHCWLDDDRLIVFSTEPQSGTHYHLYHYRNGSLGVIGGDILREDGHPSMSPAFANLMVTDTYPDRLGERSVLLFHLKTNALKRVGRFYSPRGLRGETRCDLHPRWNRAGSKISVDSAHSGERRLCIIHAEQVVDQLTGSARRATS
jgi:hypothetical protein